jgi:hypothetical protein
VGEQQRETVKKAVKKEFNRRKKLEIGLKLTHVYEDMARAAGFKNWNVYSAVLRKAAE